MFAWRNTGGSWRRVRSKATFWLAIASEAVVALEIALERASPRLETAVESFAELTTKRASSRWSALSCAAKAVARFSTGAKYLKVRLASAPRLRQICALPSKKSPSARRTGFGKVLRN